jgi:hypothetical protein
VLSTAREQLALAALILERTCQAHAQNDLTKHYDTAFWWIAGIFAVGAVTAGALLRPGPLRQASTPPLAHAEVTTAQAEAGPARPG